MGMNNLFLSVDKKKDERKAKTVNGLRQTLLLFLLTYLLLIESFYGLLCDIYFQKVSVLVINYIINSTN